MHTLAHTYTYKHPHRNMEKQYTLGSTGAGAHIVKQGLPELAHLLGSVR